MHLRDLAARLLKTCTCHNSCIPEAGTHTCHHTQAPKTPSKVARSEVQIGNLWKWSRSCHPAGTSCKETEALLGGSLEHAGLLRRQSEVALGVHVPEVLRRDVHHTCQGHRVCVFCPARKHLPKQATISPHPDKIISRITSSLQ
jgi:hypothetical protein